MQIWSRYHLSDNDQRKIERSRLEMIFRRAARRWKEISLDERSSCLEKGRTVAIMMNTLNVVRNRSHSIEDPYCVAESLHRLAPSARAERVVVTNRQSSA